MWPTNKGWLIPIRLWIIDCLPSAIVNNLIIQMACLHWRLCKHCTNGSSKRTNLLPEVWSSFQPSRTRCWPCTHTLWNLLYLAFEWSIRTLCLCWLKVIVSNPMPRRCYCSPHLVGLMALLWFWKIQLNQNNNVRVEHLLKSEWIIILIITVSRRSVFVSTEQKFVEQRSVEETPFHANWSIAIRLT